MRFQPRAVDDKIHQVSAFEKRKRVMGIEPTYPAWKAGVLPLNYTRMSKAMKFKIAESG